jgi:hypothetical protein
VDLLVEKAEGIILDVWPKLQANYHDSSQSSVFRAGGKDCAGMSPAPGVLVPGQGSATSHGDASDVII